MHTQEGVAGYENIPRNLREPIRFLGACLYSVLLGQNCRIYEFETLDSIRGSVTRYLPLCTRAS